MQNIEKCTDTRQIYHFIISLPFFVRSCFFVCLVSFSTHNLMQILQLSLLFSIFTHAIYPHPQPLTTTYDSWPLATLLSRGTQYKSLIALCVVHMSLENIIVKHEHILSFVIIAWSLMNFMLDQVRNYVHHWCFKMK